MGIRNKKVVEGLDESVCDSPGARVGTSAKRTHGQHCVFTKRVNCYASLVLMVGCG